MQPSHREEQKCSSLGSHRIHTRSARLQEGLRHSCQEVVAPMSHCLTGRRARRGEGRPAHDRVNPTLAHDRI